MKYGYLEFRYGNDPRRKSVNIGDNIQSIAVRELFAAIGIEKENVIGVDRDSLREYDGEPVRLVMNGCFHDDCFPLPPQIEPVFFGFNAETETLIKDNRAFFLKHQPIGCRDTATRRMLEKHKISAYVTGCATLTFPRREREPAAGKPIIAFGSGPGSLPSELLSRIPKQWIESACLVFQREAIERTPLTDSDVVAMDHVARRYLQRYREEASVVITPLLHVASPCLAMGIPVILARRDHNPRFTAIDRLVPLYTPKDYSRVVWETASPEFEELKAAMIETARALMGGKSPSDSVRATLARTFDAPGLAREADRHSLGKRMTRFWRDSAK